MTKEQLIKLMEEWPNDTIVRISAWPFLHESQTYLVEGYDIQSIPCEPEPEVLQSLDIK